uniref:TetR/AcrR family transcriptional regulator n=1 Tax=Thermorudis peleae TaxID=1382356 RepID=A0A831TL55_9BACT
MSKRATAPNRAHPYHHGNLRRALLDAALESIAAAGPAALSLRELARRVGVSHAAPAHHFGDKAGLLTALATEGYRLLAATLREAWERTGNFLDVGVAYVRFSIEHRPYVAVMFRPELYRAGDPALVEARQAASELLYGPLRQLARDDPALDPLRAGLAAWSLAHGFAELWTTGALPPELGDDPEQAARDVLAYLFRPVSPSG